MSTEEKTIEHARFGLSNTQNTIAFVDKKVAMGVAVVSAVLGFVYPRDMVGSKIKEVCSDLSNIDWYPIVFLIVMISVAISVILALWHAYKTIFPRTPTRSGHWVLFPFTDKDNDSLHTAIGNKFAGSGMTDRDILNEFRDQLSILGFIQAKKMSHCKATFQWLGVFSVALFIMALLSLLNQ